MNALHTAWEKLIEEESRRQKGRTDQDLWRPRLHIAPPAGWLNDPNGLCQYKGIYHAFYQLAYFQPEGGLKFWGHCTSRDLLHWEFQGVPLCPDQPFDCHGAYSGSALIEEDQMYLFYTGNVKLLGEHDYVNTGRESNTVMAVSPDGMQVDTKELLMTNGDYPDDLTRHVRDPKVWKQDGRYYMVLGARTREDEGTVLLFSSEDKKRWNYVHRFRMEKPFGYMWECPDLYVLDGHTVLSISPQGVEQDGLKFANKYQSGTCFLSGDFRETKALGEFRETKALGEFRELDGGFDFYAPQTFLADDGRRIQIGWMGMPDMEKVYRNRTVGRGWQNMLTIPRELSVRDGILCQNPVRELKEWWKEERRIKGTYSGPLEPCCELELTTEGGDVKVVLAGGLVLRYEKAEGIFWMEFTDPLLGGGRDIRGRQVGALQELRILVDVSGVEVFLNGGQDVFSTRFYPEKDQYHVEIEGSRVQGVLRYCEG